MYHVNSFKQDDPQKLKALIKDFPLGTLVTNTDRGLEANHLPFVLVEDGQSWVLLGHIAKANDLWQVLAEPADALIVFQGPSHYISPGYYPSKKETGKVVPTWNYAVVHVRGIMSFIKGESAKQEIVERLTAMMEAGRAEPWKVSDAPEDYTQRMLSAIVGIKIDVCAMEGKWKLSQNQSLANTEGVITGLESETNQDAQSMAQWVQEHAHT